MCYQIRHGYFDLCRVADIGHVGRNEDDFGYATVKRACACESIASHRGGGGSNLREGAAKRIFTLLILAPVVVRGGGGRRGEGDAICPKEARKGQEKIEEAVEEGQEKDEEGQTSQTQAKNVGGAVLVLIRAASTGKRAERGGGGWVGGTVEAGPSQALPTTAIRGPASFSFSFFFAPAGRLCPTRASTRERSWLFLAGPA